ncbi:hypothetical protein ASE28_28250 [Acidovorax sp. Root219]|nr:hypothetical protein ASE28_28250 [Acidovorax sp. Root219]
MVDISPVVRQLRGDGEPPDNGGMEARVAKLEALAEKTGERLAAIEKDTALIKAKLDHVALKEDVALTKARLEQLISKEDLALLKAKVDQLASKEDLALTKASISDAKTSIVMWVVSAIFLVQLLPVLVKRFLP